MKKQITITVQEIEINCTSLISILVKEILGQNK